VSENELNTAQIQKIEEAITLYLEPNLNFNFTRKKVLERTNRGKLKQFKSYL
jgi:phenylacetate-CoA ligase